MVLPSGDLGLPVALFGVPLVSLGLPLALFGVPLGSLWLALGCPWAPLAVLWVPLGRLELPWDNIASGTTCRRARGPDLRSLSTKVVSRSAVRSPTAGGQDDVSLTNSLKK